MATLQPADASIRAETSAYSEPSTEARICTVCRGQVIVQANYNDLWRTPVTMAPLLVEDSNGIVFNGDIRTQGLMSFGSEDGTDIEALREYLGRVEAEDAQRGALAVELVSEPSADDQAKSLEQEIINDLRALAASMETRIQPWIEEWENSSWWDLLGSFFSGVKNGLTSWWEGEGEFWSAVGDWITNLPDMIGDAWDSMTDTARALWENRHRFVELLQALAEGSVNAFEEGMDLLADALDGLPEIGPLLRDLVDQSAEWAGAMIEVATRANGVMRVLGATVLGTLMLIPPNFWAEIVGTAGGFLIPEAIIAAVFLVIAAFSGGTGGGLLVGRLTAFATRVASQMRAIGSAGRTVIRLFAFLQGLVDKMTDLVRLLLRSRRERAAGNTDVEIPVTRQVGRMRRVDPGCFDAASYAARRAPNDPAAQRDIMREYSRQLSDQQVGLNNMTVGDYLAGRDAYRDLGRSGISSGAAQAAAREDLLGQITDNVTDSLINGGMPRASAMEEAATRAQTIMSDLAALHDPDMIAAGQDVIRRVSDAGVNSSIGGSWGDATNPNSRIGRIDAAAQAAAADPNVGRNGRMNVQLEPCRGRG